MLTPPAGVAMRAVDIYEARQLLAAGFESAVGHADTAALVSQQLGIEVPVNRTSVKLPPGSEAVVAQYVGPRLPEGTKVLPDGARIDYLHVKVE